MKKALGRLFIEKAGKIAGPFYGVMRASADTTEEVKAKRKQIFNEMMAVLDFMDKELKSKGTKFFSGSKVGMYDLMVWPWIERLPVYNILYPGEGLEIPIEMSNLLAWIKNMWDLPAVKAYGLTEDTYARFYAQYFSFSQQCDFDMLLRRRV